MSTLRTDTLQNAAGTTSVPMATVVSGTAKAWVNFNGTGTVAIRASFNVSSITDLGTGAYTLNFTSEFANIDYAIVTAIGDHTGTSFNNDTNAFPAAHATTSVRLYCQNENDTSTDPNSVHAAVFR